MPAALLAGRRAGAEQRRLGQGLVAALGRGHPGHPPARPERLGRAGVPGAGERAGSLAAGGPPGGASQRAQVRFPVSAFSSLAQACIFCMFC